MCRVLVQLCNSLLALSGLTLCGIGGYLLFKAPSSLLRISLLAIGAYVAVVGFSGIAISRYGRKRGWMRLYAGLLLLLFVLQGALTIALLFYENKVFSWWDSWDNGYHAGDSAKSFWDEYSVYIKYSLLGLFVLEIVTIMAVCFFPQDMMHQNAEEDVNVPLLKKSAVEDAQRHVKNSVNHYDERDPYDDDYVNSVTLEQGELSRSKLQQQSAAASPVSSNAKLKKTGTANGSGGSGNSNVLTSPRSNRGVFVQDLTAVPSFSSAVTAANSTHNSSSDLRSPSSTTEKRRREMYEKYGSSRISSID